MNKKQINQDAASNSIYGAEDKYLEISFEDLLIKYLTKLWPIRRKLMIFNGAVLLLAIVYQLVFVKPYFDSKVTILPDYGKSSSLSALSGLAAISGMSIGDASPTDIYENLLYSESVIEPVIFSKYQTKMFSDSVDLIQYFDISMDTDTSLSLELRKRKMFIEIKKYFYEKVMKTDVDKITKILTLSIRMPESKLSAIVVNNLVNSLDDYVRTKRESNSTTQRIYIEKRLNDVNDSLAIAEKILEKFQLSNRTVQSPGLIIGQTRLMRQVQILQSVYSELSRQLEIARIDEIRDAPIINIKEYARDPVLKEGPSRLLNVFISFSISIFLSMGYFLSKEQVKILIKNIINSDTKKVITQR